MSKNLHVQAHRGASVERTENTLEAFEAAVEMGADSIELDVHLSSDGVPIVFHDFSVSPQKVEGLQTKTALKDLNYSQIKSLKLKSNRESIPSLEDVFQKLNTLNTTSLSWVDIELKREAHSKLPLQDAFVEKVIHVVSQFWKLEKTSFRSFDFNLLKEIRNRYSKARTIALIGEKQLAYSQVISEVHPQWIAPPAQSLSAEKIQNAHDLGLQIMPYTVNKVQDWEKLIAWGVDGITTDDPRALLTYLGRK